MKKIVLTLLLLTATMQIVASTNWGFCKPGPFLLKAAGPDSKPPKPQPKRCEDGPRRIIHTIRNQFHWPPIYRGSCSKLFCKDPPCLVRKKVWRWRCVLVYKLIHGEWKRIGFRRIHFLDHLKCGCKECSDIRKKNVCVKTDPCPNNKNDKSFCYYTKKGCDCCEPYPCPKGQRFDKPTCSCVCPEGSKKVGDRCIGDCSDISLDYCDGVFCDINPKFYCEVDKKWKKCVCPSCDAQKSASKCPRTRCVEQKGNPYCVYDSYDKKCRCTRCSDFNKDKKRCINSFCEDGSARCKFRSFPWRPSECFCPKH